MADDQCNDDEHEQQPRKRCAEMPIFHILFPLGVEAPE
jgi:hypothetical protein